MNRQKFTKRPVLLLEVLIAFALVVLCIFPLVTPYVYIFKAQTLFNQKILLDQSVNRFYVHLLERVYRNEIPWNAIEQKQVFTIDREALKLASGGVNLPYTGTYQLSLSRHKGGNERPLSANVVSLTITFEGNETSSKDKKKELIHYHYQFFAAKINETKQTETPEETPTADNAA